MSAKAEILRWIDRFRGGVDTAPATADDVEECLAMAWQSCREQGLPTTAETERALRDHLKTMVAPVELAILFVARVRERITGMICCGMSPADPWDRRPTMHIWLLHVKPEARRTARTVLALVRAAVSTGQAWGAERARLTVSDRQQRVVDIYRRRLGFQLEMTHHTYALDWR